MIEENKVSRDELLDRISINPSVCFGKPCIKGTRIWVSLILDFLASGMSQEEVLAEYPDLTPLDIQACLAYGAEMSRERHVPIPITSAA
jgi:uncharacterized protein (DUF433 family)